MHHIVTHGFVDRPHRSDCTAGQMDGEAGWWTTSRNIGLPPLARVMGVGSQQQHLMHMLSSDCTVDMIYLDFSKAFDKVDMHSITQAQGPWYHGVNLAYNSSNS